MLKRLSLALGIPLALLAGLPAAGAAVDPLDRPALSSPLAARTLLTAVTRAGTRLVAVGERGHIVLSDDDGATWRQAEAPTSVTLTAVGFAAPNLGWAVGHGGVVLRTVDGGATWTRQLDGRTAARLILDSTPAGDARARAEAERLVREGPDKPFFDLLVQSTREVMVVGAYGLVFATQDGGASWRPALDRVPNPERKHVYAIRLHGTAIYLAGEQGLLARSDDGGRTFSALDSPYAGSFFGLVTVPGGDVLALGLRGNLYRTGDRGGGWTKVDLGSQNSLTAGLVRRDGTIVLFDEAGALWSSGDGGRSFARRRDMVAFPFLGGVDLPGGALLAVGAGGAARLSTAAPVK